MFGAEAEAQSTGELRADTTLPNSRIALDVGLYTHQRDFIGSTIGATIVVPSLDANVNVMRISEDFSLSIDVAFRSVVSNIWAPLVDDQLDFRAGNLYAGARVAMTPVTGLRVRAGLGFVAPIMNTYNGGSNPDVALATLPISIIPNTVLPNGGWDSWMTWRGDVPLVLRADGEYRDGMFFVGAETALGLGIPVLEGREGVSVGAQLGLYGGVRLIPELAMGARFQTVLYDQGNSSSAIGFASLAPFVRGEFGGAFVETRFFLSLADNDAYRALDEKAWGLYFLGGLNF
jgi:hypothetical protein